MVIDLVKARASEKTALECCIYAETEIVRDNVDVDIVAKGGPEIIAIMLAKIIEQFADRYNMKFEKVLDEIDTYHKVGTDFAMRITVEKGMEEDGYSGE